MKRPSRIRLRNHDKAGVLMRVTQGSANHRVFRASTILEPRQHLLSECGITFLSLDLCCLIMRQCIHAVHKRILDESGWCFCDYCAFAELPDVSAGKGRRPPKEEVNLRDIDPIQFQAARCYCNCWARSRTDRSDTVSCTDQATIDILVISYNFPMYS